MNKFEIEEIENEEVEDMYFYRAPHQNVLRCPNPVFVIDTHTELINLWFLVIVFLMKNQKLLQIR
jgi:hypothetical protein